MSRAQARNSSITGEPPRERARPARRSLIIVALMAIGFWLAREVLGGVPSTMWFGLALAWAVLGAIVRGPACRVALGCAVVCAAGGWWAVRMNERATASAAWEAESRAGPITLTGLIEEEPEATGPARGALGMFVRAEPSTTFDMMLTGELSGHVRVRIGAPIGQRPAHVRAGASVSVTGLLSPVRGPMNPGEPDWRLWAAQDGLIGDLNLPSWELEHAGEASGWSERAWAFWFETRAAMHARASRALGLDQAVDPDPPDPSHAQARALLGALLLGERDAELRGVNAAFQRLGLIHLVAISGFNLAVMAGVVMFLLRLTGDRGWIEPTLVALLVIGYMLVLPAQTPILRAGVMVLALLAADASGRRFDRVTILGWVAIIMLIFKPLDAWSLGFQLSFGIVGLLLAMGDRVNDRLFGVPLRGLVAPTVAPGKQGSLAWVPAAARWLAAALKAQVSASLLAWSVATPIIAVHTGMFSPLAAVTTLIVLPLTVVVLWVGYVALLVGVLIPGAGGASGWVLERMSAFLVDVVMMLDRTPWMTVRLPALSAAWAAAAVGAVLYWFWRGHARDRLAWSLTAIVLAWFAAEVTLGPRWAARWPLRIDTLAVGDGSCMLLRSRGEAILWDCGSRSPGIGERLVPDAVRALGAWHVPTVVISAPNLDHFSGLLDVVEPLGVRRVLISAQMERAANGDGGGAAARLLAGLRDRGVRVETINAGDELTIGVARIRIIRPGRDEIVPTTGDASLVGLICTPTIDGERRVLLTGDIGPDAIGKLLGDDPDAASADGRLVADAMDLPRNGLFNEASVELLRSVNPRAVLVSGGPRHAADQRWNASKPGREWLATCDTGAIAVVIDEDGRVRVRTFADDAR